MARTKLPHGKFVTASTTDKTLLVTPEVAQLLVLLQHKRGRYSTKGYTMEKLMEKTGSKRTTLERQLEKLIKTGYAALSDNGRYYAYAEGIIIDAGVLVY